MRTIDPASDAHSEAAKSGHTDISSCTMPLSTTREAEGIASDCISKVIKQDSIKTQVP